MSDNGDRCLRCHNLSEILVDGFCENCIDALGRRRPTHPRIPEGRHAVRPVGPGEHGFELVDDFAAEEL